MSAVTPLDAIRAVMASRLDASASHVLLAWSSHVDADGKAWPSNAKLAKLTRLSVATVKRAMRTLRAAGVLVPLGESDRTTTVYQLDLDALAAFEPAEGHGDPGGVQDAPPGHGDPRVMVTHPPGHGDPPPGSPCTSPRVMVTPEEVIEEDTEEDREEDTGPRPPAEPVLVHPVAVLPDDWTQLAAHYGSLPWARKPTDRKKGNGKALATILREAGSLANAKALIDWWATADDDRALFLRYGKSREPDPLKPGAAPQQGLETVARHADDYRDRAIAWQARGSPVERGRGSHGAGYTPRPHRPSDDEPELDF